MLFPLTEGEIRQVLRLLGIPARDLLRTRDPAYADLGLAGEQAVDELIRAMARHPTLVQRPIGRLPGPSGVTRREGLTSIASLSIVSPSIARARTSSWRFALLGSCI